MLSLDSAVRAMNAGIIVDEVPEIELLAFAYPEEAEQIELDALLAH